MLVAAMLGVMWLFDRVVYYYHVSINLNYALILRNSLSRQRRKGKVKDFLIHDPGLIRSLDHFSFSIIGEISLDPG